MTRNLRAACTLVFSATVLIPLQPLYSQQSGLKTSFLTPAAIRTPNPGVSATIVEAEHLPYLTEVAKETKSPTASFQPTSSDLLIQQAEERFRNGKKAFQDGDLDHARAEFDAAIDAMLLASTNPTDRGLFESR